MLSRVQRRVGIDENGLGARLGPLIVTAVAADVTARGEAALACPLPEGLRADIGDSKRLVAHGDVALGEAWARLLSGGRTEDGARADLASSPAELVERLALGGTAPLRARCPASAAPQCWQPEREPFEADAALMSRVEAHQSALAELGLEPREVRCRVVCTGALNAAKLAGVNRFRADLHAMEELILAAREQSDGELVAICGKVGGMASYGRFFGPLSGLLHTPLEESAAMSRYRFANLGEVRFVRDADASDVLVMLASLVGKYLRELLMARIARHWAEAADLAPDARSASGYHDPVTARFVVATESVRAERGLPTCCFERSR